VCFIALLLPCVCKAQSGVVKSEGQPIPGATIKATQGERVLLTVTDDSGAFRIDNMSAGTWIVEADMFGFDHLRKEVQIGATAAKIDLTLQLRTRQAGPGGRGNAGATEDAGGDAFAGAAVVPEPVSPQIGAEASNESLMVQGSVSQGAQTNAGDFRGGDFGPGGFGPGGFPGGPGGDPNLAGGRGGGGPGGPRGGGGPGGFAGGNRGGGGPGGGGRGGPGGPGGGRGGRGNAPRDRNGNPAFIGNRARGQQNKITGSLYYTFGNSALNAKPFSVNGLVAPKAAYAQNRFGFIAGGPLFVPKWFSFPKVFWNVNYTGNLVRNGIDAAYNEPTPVQRAGDFSGISNVIYVPNIQNPNFLQAIQTDHLTPGQPFPNNQIPANLISSIATGLLQYVPLPNQSVAGVNQNYRLIIANPNNSQSLNTRLNVTLTQRDTLASTLNFTWRNADNHQVYGCCDATDGQGSNASINWRHRFGTRTFNAVNLTFNRNTSSALPFFANGPDVAGILGIQGTSRDPKNYGPPTLGFTNFSSLSGANDSRTAVWSYGATDTFQYRKGKNNWSIGGGWTHFLNNTIVDQNARGQFSFTGLSTSGYTSAGLPIQGTGYDFADFLLGLPESNAIRYGDAANYFRSNGYNAFIVDDYRLMTGLSLNLGLRYEYFTPWTEKYGDIANLYIAPNFASVTPVCPHVTTINGVTCGPTVGGVTFPEALIQSDKNNFAPRIAIAYKPFTKGKLKSTMIRAGYAWFYNPSQYNRFASSSALAGQPPFANTNSATTVLNNPAQVLTLATGLTNTSSKSVLNTYAVALNYLNSYAQTWNLGVQGDLPGRLVAEITYNGTKGTRLDYTQAPNQAALGSSITSENRFPIAGVGQFTFDTPSGNSSYNAAQIRLTRRMQKGVSANLFYTFAKSIDDLALAQNFYNQAAERGLSTGDHRHVVQANWVLTSPVDATRGVLAKPVWLSKSLKDWTLSGSLTAQTGAPLTPTVTGNISGTGTAGPERANVVPGQSIDSGSGYFNTAAFSIPLAGTFGNAGRGIITGPGSFGMNLSLSRSVNLKSERYRLEVRFDSNNTLNHVNPTGLITVVNSSQYGLITNASQMRQISATVRLRF
jgi:trimeric autotransporter adhesin